MAGFAKGMATTSGWTLVRCAGTGYFKSANDESLSRDEGGGRNLFMEVVTYKTVQGRHAHDAGDGNIFSCPWMQLRAGTGELRRGAHGTCEPTTFKLQ